MQSAEMNAYPPAVYIPRRTKSSMLSSSCRSLDRHSREPWELSPWIENVGSTIWVITGLDRACGSSEYRKVQNGLLAIPSFGMGDYACTGRAMENKEIDCWSSLKDKYM